MIINEINATSIITKSNLPDADYVINPYVGCTHSCIYCYASFMKRFTGHSEEWGSFIDVKVNAPDLIPEKTSKYKGKRIFISSVTDPYLALEKKYQLTRRVLGKLVPLKPSLDIQTKSDLILRDIELFTQFDDCEVGFTITTLSDQIRKEIEPFTSSPDKRVEALKKLKAAGVTTYVFIGPILPFVTDWKEIIETTKEFVDSYMLENLNIAGEAWNHIKKWLKERHPELLKKYEEIYFSPNDYWDMVENDIKSYCEKHDIKHNIYFHHNKNKKR